MAITIVDEHNRILMMNKAMFLQRTQDFISEYRQQQVESMLLKASGM